ncbi:hypothetical protein EXIGLDRAFT_383360 [Exidia glandulosa HHB12029]|uniref:Uncharacterized protein n=1 Tax=Exidia glandulosa HHB12029 TaxID=1314781 RepID=A0A165L2S4_EXIGL|nr:hypothetical protein EXIGLDRAFT_383360 [Exidia glandulosa HHB12029]
MRKGMYLGPRGMAKGLADAATWLSRRPVLLNHSSHQLRQQCPLKAGSASQPRRSITETGDAARLAMMPCALWIHLPTHLCADNGQSRMIGGLGTAELPAHLTAFPQSSPIDIRGSLVCRPKWRSTTRYREQHCDRCRVSVWSIGTVYPCQRWCECIAFRFVSTEREGSDEESRAGQQRLSNVDVKDEGST